MAAALDVAGATLVAGAVEVGKPDDLLALADEVRAALPDAAVALLADLDGRVAVVVTLPDALVGRGLRAGDVLAAMMPAVGGRGGGKPTLARGGGTDASGMGAALEAGIARSGSSSERRGAGSWRSTTASRARAWRSPTRPAALPVP